MKKLNLKSSYTLYKNSVKNPISYNEYAKINTQYFKFIIGKVMKGDKVYLPYRMGCIQVKGKEQQYKVEDGVIKGLAPDWKATREYRLSNPDSTKVIFHTNTHTDNVRYKIRWYKFNIFAKNKGFYSLRFTRSIKRELSALIKNKTYEYEVL